MEKKLKKMRAHFVGIGGIGMSALALLAKDLGWEVYGSNIDRNEIVKEISKKGIKVFIGHSSNNWMDPDVVVVSSAVPKDNPELFKATISNVEIIERLRFFSRLAKGFKVLSVTGTDGKTTTTAMLGHIVQESGYDPTIILGGIHPIFKNYKKGNGKYMVAEIDESDGKFADFSSYASIITNVRYDHLNNYGGRIERYLEHFRNFIMNTSEIMVYNLDDMCEISRKLFNEFRGKLVTFGINSQNADYTAINIFMEKSKSFFDLVAYGSFVGRITVPIPGIHNVYNALSAIALSMELGMEIDAIQQAMKTYKSVDRRFSIRFKDNRKQVYVLDDYAHTPMEIKYTVDTVRKVFEGKKLVAIFQPHRYSRLAMENGRFSYSLLKADEVIITKVYSAYEEEIPGVSAREVHEKLHELGKKTWYVENFDELERKLEAFEKRNTVFLFLGAGDISMFATNWVKKLSPQHK